jgi:hypothetical protein
VGNYRQPDYFSISVLKKRSEPTFVRFPLFLGPGLRIPGEVARESAWYRSRPETRLAVYRIQIMNRQITPVCKETNCRCHKYVV